MKAKIVHSGTSSFKATQREITQSNVKATSELSGNLVSYSSQQPSKDYCDKSYSRRPYSASKPTNTARTLIPDLQETQQPKLTSRETILINGFDKIMKCTDEGIKITKCERKHSDHTYSSNVFNMNMAVKPNKPMFSKVATPIDRNVNMIGYKGSNCLKDKAMEPCIVSPSKNMKNFRDFRSSIIGMPGSTTSRQPLSNGPNSSSNRPIKAMMQQKNIEKLNILSCLDNIEQQRETKQGKKKFITKDAIIYGTIEKEEKMPNELGRKGNPGIYNVFRSHIDAFA